MTRLAQTASTKPQSWRLVPAWARRGVIVPILILGIVSSNPFFAQSPFQPSTPASPTSPLAKRPGASLAEIRQRVDGLEAGVAAFPTEFVRTSTMETKIRLPPALPKRP